MRLLDRIAKCREPTALLGRSGEASLRVTGPADFAAAVRDCPVRYVLADDLTEECSELAFAGGDRFAACLDPIRIPAPLLWIEWADGVQQDVLSATGLISHKDPAASRRRVGVLIRSSPCGACGTVRTFWGGAGDTTVTLAPIETQIDLSGDFPRDPLGEDVLAGGTVRLRDPVEPVRNALFDCARFRFDRRWAAAYRSMVRTPGDLDSVLRGSVGSVARDIPLLFALFLLLNARSAMHPVPADLSALNRKRRRTGKVPPLDHLQLHSALGDAVGPRRCAEQAATDRRAARLHHVRAHLVRRENNVFWRRAHLRGKASFGTVRSRTVHLTVGGRDQPQR